MIYKEIDHSHTWKFYIAQNSISWSNGMFGFKKITQTMRSRTLHSSYSGFTKQGVKLTEIWRDCMSLPFIMWAKTININNKSTVIWLLQYIACNVHPVSAFPFSTPKIKNINNNNNHNIKNKQKNSFRWRVRIEDRTVNENSCVSLCCPLRSACSQRVAYDG